MADDDNNDNNDNNDGNGREYDDDSFEGYIPQTADPGRWLLWGTLAAVMMLMLVIMPIMVYATKTQRKKEKLAVEIQMTMSGSQAPPDYDALVDKDTAQPAPSFVIMNGENVISRAIFRTKPTDKHKATCWTIFRIDKESRHLLRYTFPSTVYLCRVSFSNAKRLPCTGWKFHRYKTPGGLCHGDSSYQLDRRVPQGSWPYMPIPLLWRRRTIFLVNPQNTIRVRE